MTIKTFDKRVRALAAALKELGSTAAEGTNFTLVKVEKRWAWEPVEVKPLVSSAPLSEALAEVVSETAIKSEVKAANARIAKKAKATKPKKPAKMTKPKETKKSGVIAAIPAIVSRTSGATLAEIVKALKIKFPEREEKKLASTAKVNMKKACAKAGVTLRSERKPGKLIRYFGV
jgi:hypothetical protein